MTDICRLCASLKTLEHLTPIDEPSLSLKRKLLRCCQLELPSNADVLPQNVCDNCVQRLESAWTFAESVAQAQETLQTAFSTTDFVRQPVKTVNKVWHSSIINSISKCTNFNGHISRLNVKEQTHR